MIFNPVAISSVKSYSLSLRSSSGSKSRNSSPCAENSISASPQVAQCIVNHTMISGVVRKCIFYWGNKLRAKAFNSSCNRIARSFAWLSLPVSFSANKKKLGNKIAHLRSPTSVQFMEPYNWSHFWLRVVRVDFFVSIYSFIHSLTRLKLKHYNSNFQWAIEWVHGLPEQ